MIYFYFEEKTQFHSSKKLDEVKLVQKIFPTKSWNVCFEKSSFGQILELNDGKYAYLSENKISTFNKEHEIEMQFPAKCVIRMEDLMDGRIATYNYELNLIQVWKGGNILNSMEKPKIDFIFYLGNDEILISTYSKLYIWNFKNDSCIEIYYFPYEYGILRRKPKLFHDRFILLAFKKSTILFLNRVGKILQSMEFNMDKMNNGRSNIYSLELSDRRICLCIDDEIEIWDRNFKTKLLNLTHNLQEITCVQEYKGKLYSSHTDGSVNIWSLNDGSWINSFKIYNKDSIKQFVISNDQIIAIPMNHYQGELDRHKRIKIKDKSIFPMSYNDGMNDYLAKKYYVTCNDETIHQYEREIKFMSLQGKLIHSISYHEDEPEFILKFKNGSIAIQYSFKLEILK